MKHRIVVLGAGYARRSLSVCYKDTVSASGQPLFHDDHLATVITTNGPAGGASRYCG